MNLATNLDEIKDEIMEKQNNVTKLKIEDFYDFPKIQWN